MFADAETLYLSASSFESPFNHMRHSDRYADTELNIHMVRAIMTFIKDVTDEFQNPGLKVGIKNDVLASLKVMNYLKRMHMNAESMRRYIIRRYVATTSGVLQVYPGCLMDAHFEPMRRLWFQRAMELPGRLVITEPYLDAGGAGYVVTVAFTVFQSKYATNNGADYSGTNYNNNKNDNIPVAVIALDLTQGFFYKLLLDSTHFCGVDSIKCFLMDDRGYLIAHPSIILPTVNSNRELPEHFTTKESQVASDVLNHQQFVAKRVCNNYINRTTQR